MSRQRETKTAPACARGPRVILPASLSYPLPGCSSAEPSSVSPSSRIIGKQRRVAIAHLKRAIENRHKRLPGHRSENRHKRLPGHRFENRHKRLPARWPRNRSTQHWKPAVFSSITNPSKQPSVMVDFQAPLAGRFSSAARQNYQLAHGLITSTLAGTTSCRQLWADPSLGKRHLPGSRTLPPRRSRRDGSKSGFNSSGSGA